jgi:DNA-binding MarR family transcriptional regulator
MLLGERFGKITEEQRKRLEAIKSSVTQLHDALFDMLDDKEVGSGY